LRCPLAHFYSAVDRQTKFEANVVRDNAARSALLAAGWRVATVWECAVRKPQHLEVAANLLAAWLRSGAAEIEIGETEVVEEQVEG
jgi:DNA mismatch endonuclease (patch repair protein)